MSTKRLFDLFFCYCFIQILLPRLLRNDETSFHSRRSLRIPRTLFPPSEHAVHSVRMCSHSSSFPQRTAGQERFRDRGRSGAT